MDTPSIPPPPPLADATLWACVQADDADAFAQLFDRHHVRVHRHAMRWADSPQDAEDVVSAVFLEAWRRRDDVAIVDGTLLPWLLATANHLRRNRDRSGNRKRRAVDRMRGQVWATSPDHAEDVAERIDAGHRAHAVRRAFDRLDPLAQDVLTLCTLEGHSMAAAAAVLGCPVGTVKSRLSRARAQLRRAVEETAEPTTVTPLRPPAAAARRADRAHPAMPVTAIAPTAARPTTALEGTASCL